MSDVMITTPLDRIDGIVSATRATFASGRTRPEAWRTVTLRRLRELLVQHEPALLAALALDLGKPGIEAWTTEIGFTIAEIDHALAHLSSWMKPERVATPVTLQPASSHIVPEPLGVVAVIAPWNYPVQLLLAPIVAAVAAGNAVVAKPSELAPASAEALARLLAELADPAVTVVEGGVAETTELLRQRFDHIIYTGNGRVARVVMRAAAEHLTPVTLELGGKSPTIVSRHARLDVTARRIVWGKFVNAGQTCIAPDYVLVERPVHDELVAAMVAAVGELYGVDPAASPDYGRIVSAPQFHRIEKLLHEGRAVCGGTADPDTRYIAPTILTGITRAHAVMAEEIFGPVLPVLAVDSLDEAIAFVNADDKPLALYAFSEQRHETDRIVAGTSSGGVTVNGTLMHVANPQPALRWGGPQRHRRLPRPGRVRRVQPPALDPGPFHPARRAAALPALHRDEAEADPAGSAAARPTRGARPPQRGGAPAATGRLTRRGRTITGSGRARRR